MRFLYFRFLITPADRYKGGLFDSESAKRAFDARKNKLFAQALSKLVREGGLKSNRREVAVREVAKEDEVTLLALSPSKRVAIESRTGEAATVPHWPGVRVAVWNDPATQVILVQDRASAFQNPDTVAKSLQKYLGAILELHDLELRIQPMWEAADFWSMIKGKRISKIEFRLDSPNLPTLSDDMDDDLLEFMRRSNSMETTVAAKAAPSGTLHISEETPLVGGMVKYASGGAGEVTVKPEGEASFTISKKRKTRKSTTITTIKASAPTAEDLVAVIKALKRFME